MTKIAKIWNTITNNILVSQAIPPSVVTIPAANVDCHADLEKPFEAYNDYFQVTINQLFLKNGREWLTNIDPMVFVVSEFSYDRKMQEVPYIVGPGLVSQHGQKEPHGMLFRNEKVAGLHPYNGGPLTLSVVLCQVPVGSPAQTFLGVLENATKQLNLATTVTPYLNVGKVILDGIDAILGLDKTKPLVGLRTTFNSVGGDPLKPNYFAIIDAPNIKPASLKVENNQLFHNSTGEPYQDADFVLYSLMRAPDKRRDDCEQLPFYDLWERTVLEATSLKEGSWENAKANMISLMNTIYLSPDVTRPQALELIEKYQTDLKSIHENAIGISNLSDSDKEMVDALDEVRLMAGSIFKS